MPLKKNFLILISDSGYGHRSAANAVAKAMQIQHPEDSNSVIVNPILEQQSPQPLKISEKNYDHLVTTNPKFYRFTYEISDSRPASGLVENVLTVALYGEMKQLIQDLHPNAILSTNLMYSNPTGVVLDSMEHRPPFYTTVTDFTDVHAMWFNDYPDRFFVASEEAHSKAIECGIDPQKITISGIPVNPDFATNQTPKSELRKKLGLDPKLTTLLFVGSPRVNGIFEHLEALETVSLPFLVVLIAGGDKELYEKVCERQWAFPIQVQNRVTNMPQWMLASDLLVTKAGGLILSEGLAAGLPILLIDYLPGQEEGNVRFVVDHKVGKVVESVDKFPALVIELLNDDQSYLKELSSNARQCGHPDSALVIAEALWKADEKGKI
ncbi:MAG TPA: glycosyltransferase [Anaerolineaceae bacterium]|nr:glycosyltransferase [Anaerolineaceae bacterium]